MAEQKPDRILRFTLLRGGASLFIASSKNLCEEGKKIHNASPEGAAALGRAMTGALLLRQNQKESWESLSVIFRGGGPAGTMIVTATENSVRGYLENPQVFLPAKNGKLDVGGFLGCNGTLTVLRDTLGQPQQGICRLVSGEVAEDIAQYLLQSEQIRSFVSLGVEVQLQKNQVSQAGGILVSPLPGLSAMEEDILAQACALLPPVTQLFAEMEPEEVVPAFFFDLQPELLGEVNILYRCNCSRQRMGRALASLPGQDIAEMLREGQPAEVGCRFCNKKYVFSLEDLSGLLAEKQKTKRNE